jgi:hypothetical protein
MKDTWIRCADAMPIDDREVLVRRAGGRVQMKEIAPWTPNFSRW